MKTTDYPKQINFKCHDPNGMTPDAQEWISRIKDETKIKMLAENIIQITYPADIVEEIRTVNIDDMIYRLDFVAPGDQFWMCDCVFPEVPWNNRDFMKNRWGKGLRLEMEGALVIEYPILKD